MGYYYIRLSKEAINLCTIILPWVEYKYKRPPMGVCNSPYVFQAKMNKIFHELDFIQSYIDDLIIITKGDWSDYFEKS